MYELVYSRAAIHFLRKIPKNTAKIICSKLEKLAKNPYAPNNNVKSLKGTKANYRLRIGNFRELYILNTNPRQIIIVNIATRGEIYKL
jgi:mRNA interferase RelE/StbE